MNPASPTHSTRYPYDLPSLGWDSAANSQVNSGSVNTLLTNPQSALPFPISGSSALSSLVVSDLLSHPSQSRQLADDLTSLQQSLQNVLPTHGYQSSIGLNDHLYATDYSANRAQWNGKSDEFNNSFSSFKSGTVTGNNNSSDSINPWNDPALNGSIGLGLAPTALFRSRSAQPNLDFSSSEDSQRISANALVDSVLDEEDAAALHIDYSKLPQQPKLDSQQANMNSLNSIFSSARLTSAESHDSYYSTQSAAARSNNANQLNRPNAGVGSGQGMIQQFLGSANENERNSNRLELNNDFYLTRQQSAPQPSNNSHSNSNFVNPNNSNSSILSYDSPAPKQQITATSISSPTHNNNNNNKNNNTLRPYNPSHNSSYNSSQSPARSNLLSNAGLQSSSNFAPASPLPAFPTSPPIPSAPANESEAFQILHDEILQFALQCQQLQAAQLPLREELASRTRWAVRTVWPSAEVDLVGSVSARVALPKSDLDFVVYFPPCKDTENRPDFTFSAPLDADAVTVSKAAAISTAFNAAQTAALQQAALTIANGGIPDPISIPNPFPTPIGAVIQHFAHAGSLIKLIGGRKKSKILFRSTKIQVFKDINLIRLRDGCSGISMDLWFPINSFISRRSQAHTALIHSFINSFPAFYPLACVVKTFMQQNLLNSGYSGLGSYGVLLMIVRYLQHERSLAGEGKSASNGIAGAPDKFLPQFAAASKPVEVSGPVPPKAASEPPNPLNSSSSTKAPTASSNSSMESNLGKLLCGFFRFYCYFDYCKYAVNINQPETVFPKPEVAILSKKKKELIDKSDEDGGARKRRNEDFDDEDERESDEERERNNPDLDDSDNPLVNDHYTLVIQDPEDEANFIICHHKALRNMIHAFIRALSILDPTEELPPNPPPLMIPVNPASATFNGEAGDPAEYNPALVSLPALPVPSANNPHSRFLRLIDNSAAHAGPAMKSCQECSSFCPIQNKVCFQCGFMFVKSAIGGAGSSNGGKMGSGNSKGQQGNNKGIGKGINGNKNHRNSPANQNNKQSNNNNMNNNNNRLGGGNNNMMNAILFNGNQQQKQQSSSNRFRNNQNNNNNNSMNRNNNNTNNMNMNINSPTSSNGGNSIQIGYIPVTNYIPVYSNQTNGGVNGANFNLPNNNNRNGGGLAMAPLTRSISAPVFNPEFEINSFNLNPRNNNNRSNNGNQRNFNSNGMQQHQPHQNQHRNHNGGGMQNGNQSAMAELEEFRRPNVSSKQQQRNHHRDGMANSILKPTSQSFKPSIDYFNDPNNMNNSINQFQIPSQQNQHQQHHHSNSHSQSPHHAHSHSQSQMHFQSPSQTQSQSQYNPNYRP